MQAQPEEGADARAIEIPLADDLLDGVPAASAFTGFSPRQLYRMVETNTVPHRKVGGKLIFTKSSLRRALTPAA